VGHSELGGGGASKDAKVHYLGEEGGDACSELLKRGGILVTFSGISREQLGGGFGRGTNIDALFSKQLNRSKSYLGLENFWDGEANL